MFFIHFCETTHEKKNIYHTHAHTRTNIKTGEDISEINQPCVKSCHCRCTHLCHDTTSWCKNLPGRTIADQLVGLVWNSSQTSPWGPAQALEGRSASRQGTRSPWHAPCQSVSIWGGRAVTFVVWYSDRFPICCKCSLSPRWRASSASACRACPFLGEDSSSCQ